MAGAGYDIGVSESHSSSADSALNSAFNVTGGGGSSATSLGPASPIAGTGTPAGVAAWLPYLVVGVVVLGLLAFAVSRRKRK